MKVLLIIPAYNEEGNLPVLLDKLNSEYPEYDRVVINDCSHDDTIKVCEERKVQHIDLPVNLGIAGAVQTGFRYAAYHEYDVGVQVDGDGQHNPEYIKDLIDKIKQGYDVVIGSRFINRVGFQSTMARRTGIVFFRTLIRLLTGKDFTDPTSGFRAFNRNAMQYFALHYPVDYAEPEVIVLLHQNRFKTVEVPVIMNERHEGKSSINFNRSLYYIIKVTLAILIVSLIGRGKE